MVDNREVGFFIAFILFAVWGNFLLTLPLILPIFLLDIIVLNSVFAIFVGLFSGWIFYSIMSKFRMSPRESILGGVFIPIPILKLIFLVGFTLMNLIPHLGKITNETVREVIQFFPDFSITAMVIYSLLYYLGFNAIIFRTVLKEGHPEELNWYFLGIAVWFIVFFVMQFSSSLAINIIF